MESPGSRQVGRYAERLFPAVVANSAKADPHRLVGKLMASSERPDSFIEMTMGQLDAAVNFMAYWLHDSLKHEEEKSVIGYMGPNDFRYHIMFIAALKIGHPILLPSTRNSVSNNAALFAATSCKYFFTAHAFTKRMVDMRVEGLRVQQIPALDELLDVTSPEYPYDRDWETTKEDITVIFHTSGSTGNPKPILYNHFGIAAWDGWRLCPCPSESKVAYPSAFVSPDEFTYFATAFPFFHIVGLALCSLSILYNTAMVLPATDTPAHAGHIVDIMRYIQLRAIALPPAIWDDVVKEYKEDFVERRSGLTMIYSGGGPLLPATGNFLSSYADVFQIYGQTEIGWLHLLQPKSRSDWQYISFNHMIGGQKLVPIGGDPNGLHELIIVRYADRSRRWSQPAFETAPETEVWHTNDMFEKHATKEIWRYRGRSDDILVLNGGEKLNPVAAELHIQSHPYLDGALVIGASYNQTALLLEPKLTLSAETRGGIVTAVWPKVEEANAELPAHGKIFKHMVLTVPPGRSFRRAGKGTILRSATEREFKAEIEDLYAQAEVQQVPTNELAFLQLSKDTVADFVSQCVAHQLGQSPDTISASANLFSLGVDSLQTSELSRTLSNVFMPYMPPKAKFQITARFVYRYPSVGQLAKAIKNLLDPSATANGGSDLVNDDRDHALMKSLIEGYSIIKNDNEAATYPISNYRPQIPLTVLLTGSTGYVGHYILRALVSSENIGSVICLNRSAAAETTFLSQWRQHGREERAADKVRFLQASFAEPRFGLTEQTFRWLQDTVGVVIANAWTVDFNLTLSSFVFPHIVGLGQLIEFSIGCKARPQLVFMSSIAAAGNWTSIHPGERVVEGLIRNFDAPSLDGYGQSKFVGEHVMASARHAGLDVKIVRVGQVAGSLATSDGPGWKQSEWFPLLLATSKALGYLPASLGSMDNVDWVPVDIVAAAVFDIVLKSSAESNQAEVFNLTNPSAVSYSELLPGILQHLGMSADAVIPLADWISKLQSLDATDPTKLIRYPALRILHYYEQINQLDDAGANPDFANERAAGVSKVLGTLGPVTSAMLKRWMESWNFVESADLSHQVTT